MCQSSVFENMFSFYRVEIHLGPNLRDNLDNIKYAQISTLQLGLMEDDEDDFICSSKTTFHFLGRISSTTAVKSQGSHFLRV